MGFGVLAKYKKVAIAYSFVREYAGTPIYRDIITSIYDYGCDVYVASDFKLLHQCVLHQNDDKDINTTSSFKSLISNLLSSKKLHEITAVTSSSYISAINDLDDICLIVTRQGVLFKRMIENKLRLDKPIILLSKNGYDVYENSDDCYSHIKERQVSALAAKTEFLDAHVFCNVGDLLQTGKGADVRLSTRISNGAEGMIFRTDNPEIVAKIYHRGMITPLRWMKLTRMVELGFNSKEICWPKDLLLYKGIPVGYSMRLGQGSTLSNILDGPDAVLNAFPKWERIDVVDTLLTLLEKYIYLHMHDIVVGDIQLKNALLYSSSSVYLIDMDSSQIGNLPCPVGTEEFTAPELWGCDFVDFLRKLHHEDYNIAMLVFSVLFCGVHPYSRRNGKETLREEILDRAFPYRLDFTSEEFIPVGGYNYIWRHLTDTLRVMLYDVFALGKTHEAIEWYSVVLEYRDLLANNLIEDEEAYKVFPYMNYKGTVVDEKPKTSYNFKDAVYDSSTNPFAAAAAEPEERVVASLLHNQNRADSPIDGSLFAKFGKK